MKLSALDKQPSSKPRLMHRAFDVVVVLKGVDGAIEIIGGIALFFVKTGVIAAFTDALTARELSDDPNDFVANTLRYWAAGFGHSSQMFAAGYLLFHGIAKVALATFLLMGKAWAYPVALAFFTTLVGYAVFRLSLGWTWTLAALVLLDIVAICLVAREWRATSSARAQGRIDL